jgi:hypothetical protein
VGPDFPPSGEPAPRGGSAPRAGRPNEPLRAAREWLVAELRDECSDIGVSARGFDFGGFLRGVATFAREARRLGAPAERMLVLLKQCLADERLPHGDRELYQQYRDAAVRTAITTYYDAAADDLPGGAEDARPSAEPPRADG